MHSQNLDWNQLSLSETTELGNPCKRHFSRRKMFAICFIGVSVESGIKCAILENRSTTTQIFVCPLYSRSPTIKSIEISSRGLLGMSKGSSNQYFLCRVALFR